METTTHVETYEVGVEDEEGRTYVGRITGQQIASDERTQMEVYRTEDGRVLLYDGERQKYWEVQYPVEELRDALPPAVYADAMHALGETPVVDL